MEDILAAAKTSTTRTPAAKEARPDRPTAKAYLERLKANASEAERVKYERYFPLAERGDDVFIGVRMGTVFELARAFVDMPPGEIETLLESAVHEARAGAVSIMAKQAQQRKVAAERREELYALYLRRHDRINTWDLVDLGAWYVVGSWLKDKPRDILHKLAKSKRPMERRTAILATFAFMRAGADDTYAIAETLLGDGDALVQKAVGWALRVAGDYDRPRLEIFLKRHAAAMPRIALRNAIEKFAPEARKRYLALRKE